MTNDHPPQDVPTFIAPLRIDGAGDVRFFAPPRNLGKVMVDLTDTQWIAPIGIVGLLALCHRAESDGLDLMITVPRDDAVRNFLNESGFLAALETMGIDVDEVRETAAPGPIQPCLRAAHVSHESQMEKAALDLQAILEEIRAPGQAVNAMYQVMTEVTNNAWQHGEGCYVMAQTHRGESSGRPGLELAIADMGIGFAATLERRLGRLPETEAITRAFEAGITSTDDPHRGYGLFWVRDAVDNYPGDAEMSVVSFDGMVRLAGGELDTWDGHDCRGVFVTAYFPFTME